MARLTDLTLNDQGFAFDPTTGTSYTLNPTALLLVRGLRDGLQPEVLADRLVESFAIPRERAVTDLTAFTHELSQLGLA